MGVDELGVDEMGSTRNGKYTKWEVEYTVNFGWKNLRIFCIALNSHIFPTKNNCI